MSRMIPDHDNRITEEQARDAMPWASAIVRAEGCWIGWQYVSDYLHWLRQR